MDDFPTVYWHAWDSDATFLPGHELPSASAGLLWAVLVILYYGDKLVLADIAGRGLCIPSGKVEDGETIDQAVEREVHEETGATIDPDRRRMIGCYRLTSRAPETLGRVRYCPVFIAEALGLGPIPAGSESQGVFYAPIEDVAELYYTWDELMAAVFDYAGQVREELMPEGFSLSRLMEG